MNENLYWQLAYNTSDNKLVIVIMVISLLISDYSNIDNTNNIIVIVML